MKSGYESLIWVNDTNGKEYVCSIDTNDSRRWFEQLSDDERNRCADVNEIIGTERW